MFIAKEGKTHWNEPWAFISTWTLAWVNEIIRLLYTKIMQSTLFPYSTLWAPENDSVIPGIRYFSLNFCEKSVITFLPASSISDSVYAIKVFCVTILLFCFGSCCTQWTKLMSAVRAKMKTMCSLNLNHFTFTLYSTATQNSSPPFGWLAEFCRFHCVALHGKQDRKSVV